MTVRGVLRVYEDGSLGFWCPGCQETHTVDASWGFNGNHDKPTFSASVLVSSGHFSSQWKAGEDCWCTFNAKFPESTGRQFHCMRCHSMIKDGHIQFLSDSTHELASKTVPLEYMS